MPENASIRITAIDALRGFCLLGIIYAHYIYWHSGGPLPQEYYTRNYGVGSAIFTWFHNLFIFGKFFSLFSFLFGLSFFLQMGNKQGETGFVRRYLRRLFILLLIALVHQTFWMGDILIIYIPLAFMLLAMRGAPDKTVFILAVLLILNVPGKLWDALNFLVFKLDTQSLAADFSKEYEQIIKTATLPQLWKFNWKTIGGKAHFQVFSGRLLQTLGFFLLGMYAGRKKWFENIARNKTILSHYLKKACIIAGISLAIAVGIVITNSILKLGLEQNQVVGFFFSIIFDLITFMLVTIYVTGFMLLMVKKRAGRILAFFAPLGKMALTSYLLQTVVGLALFFSFGFGLMGKTSPGWNFVIATIVLILQAIAAAYWFKYFRYGPVEWLWRSGTALQWQPFRQEPSVTLQPSQALGQTGFS